jgi:hypothetical protein
MRTTAGSRRTASRRLILDGHARLAAAIAESTVPPLLHLHRTVPSDEVGEGTARVHLYEFAGRHGRPSGCRQHSPPGPGRCPAVKQWRRVAYEVTADQV